jgi:hypothetical protein
LVVRHFAAQNVVPQAQTRYFLSGDLGNIPFFGGRAMPAPTMAAPNKQKSSPSHNIPYIIIPVPRENSKKKSVDGDNTLAIYLLREYNKGSKTYYGGRL